LSNLLKLLVTGFAAGAVLAGCAHSVPTAQVQPTGTSAAASLKAIDAPAPEADRAYVAPSKSLGGVAIQDDSRLGLSPEKAEVKARERATAWHADAELRFVGWGVLVFQPLSAVSHVFYSPSANEVLVVKTLMRDKWQNADAYNHVIVTKPATVLQPLKNDYKIPGDHALKLVRKHFFVKFSPTLLTLSQPIKVPFAFWAAIGDSNVVLVHAGTGQSVSARRIDPFPKEWNK
jgi:hypothetical protein